LRVSTTGTIAGGGYQGPRIQFTSYNEAGIGSYFAGFIQAIWMAANNKFDLYLGGASAGNNVTCLRLRNDGTIAVNGNATFEAGLGFSGGSLITKIATNGLEVYNSDTEIPTSNAVFNSPAFYGVPTVPTPTSSVDNSYQIANTAWVNAALARPGTTNTSDVGANTVISYYPIAAPFQIYYNCSDAITITALTSGYEINGMLHILRVRDNGTARSLSFSGAFVKYKASFPTATVAGKWMYFTCRYNSSDSSWDIVDFAVKN
jgi:hypothetical protein